MRLRNLLLLILFFICPSIASAQFSQENIIADTDALSNFFAVDIDSDGDNDIIIVDGGNILWRENLDGLGNFSSEKELILGGGGTVIPVKFDSDDDYDLLVKNSEIVWYENLDGLGNFGPKIVIKDSGAQSVYYGDIDQDNDTDIVTIRFDTDGFVCENYIEWFRNEGNGNFTLQNVVDQYYNKCGKDIALLDVDGDNDLDIVALNDAENIGENGWVSYYLNEDGLGSFGEEQNVTNFPGNKPVSFTITDLDNDQDIDIVVKSWFANGNATIISYLENNENGTFTSISGGVSYDWEGGYHIADLNGDNHKDCVYGSGPGGGFEPELAWKNSADLTTNIIFQGLYNPLYKSIYASDLDGDNDKDIIVLTIGENDFFWSENLDGLGNFGPRKLIAPGAFSGYAIVATDLNNDGLTNLITGSFNQNWFNGQIVSWNYINESIITPTPINNYGTNWDINWLTVGDLNNDTYPDLITLGLNSGMNWWENQGAQNQFSSPISIPNGPSAWSDNLKLIISDLDNDNDNDILIPILDENVIYWLENENSLGNFGEPIIIDDQLNTLVDAAAENLDDDADLDIICATSTSLIWFKNENGSGGFGSAITIDDIAFLSSITSGDLNNDGKIDVLIASTSGTIAWYENEDGLGTFGTQNIITSNANGAKLIKTFDVDSDGDLDILISTSNQTTWYENIDGLGTFASENIITGQESIMFDIGDFNHDNAVDLLCVHQDKFSWYENISNNINQLSGICFWDVNENGIQDPGELILNEQGLILQPDNLYTNSSELGAYLFFLDTGAYNLSLPVTSNWIFTMPDSQMVILNDYNIDITQNIGLKPLANLQQTEISLSSGPTRCGFEVPFWLNLSNNGTETNEGTITLSLDENPLVSFVSASPSPSSISGNLLTWDYADMLPTYEENIFIILQMPGTDALGEQIELTATATIEEGSGSVVFTDEYNFQSIINCAYDPNDKLVSPQYEGDFNYVLPSDTLAYTIRFQNTGTDTAFNVRITDQLDEYLDWTTFRVISSSHSYEVLLNDSGLIEFNFANILLPDSTTNEILSHGYISYEILPLSGLENGQVIENGADIFFDFNPPIQTNVVESIFTYILDEDGDGYGIADDCDDTDPAINPDAIEIVNNDIDENCDEYFAQDADNDGFWDDVDCDDDNPAINPDVTEIIYNGLDDDCNPLTLDDDLDEDGYNLVDDCDDTDATINPDAVEIPNNDIDENCDEYFAVDADNDGYFDDVDCDEMNPAINPGADEIPYNDIDEDCTSSTPDDDLDGDGFGIEEDCDDLDDDINPAAQEIGNNDVDENCDDYFAMDLDLDGFFDDVDCDDMNPDINPNATEIPDNGIDEDCVDGDLITISTNEIEKLRPQIFPNPTTGKLNIQVPYSTSASLIIKDYSGKTILAQSLATTNTINLATLPSGVYIVLIQTKGQLWTERVVKM